MNDCNCDVCNLLRFLDEQLEGNFDRAAASLIQALWRVIAEAEGQDQARFLQELAGHGLDLNTYSLLRTAVKLGSWELDTPAEETAEAEEESQTFLH